jgi:low affinity Fe/Cu permease
MERFKKTIATLESQAKLERHQLHEEHHQCVQIELNDKKNKALRAFVKALKKAPSDGNAVLTAVRRFLKICTDDRIHK